MINGVCFLRPPERSCSDGDQLDHKANNIIKPCGRLQKIDLSLYKLGLLAVHLAKSLLVHIFMHYRSPFPCIRMTENQLATWELSPEIE